MSTKQIIILVHGWSVTNTSTYGELPARLETEAKLGNAPEVDIRQIYLSEYISFNDDVLLPDLAHAFEAALHRELADLLNQGKKFMAITHSTGGPVIRYWWQKLYVKKQRTCPMSHCIMLAPANFGSALAQLGKSRLSRFFSRLEGVEPGTGILNWLELGSTGSWDLNQDWICDIKNPVDETPAMFPFVLAGQTVDHKFYDHLNSYTGETGSDGVVRVAAANLNARYFRLTQNIKTNALEITTEKQAPKTAFAIIPGASHSGDALGILRSIKKNHDNHPTVNAILACMHVTDKTSYEKVCERFTEQTGHVQTQERVRMFGTEPFLNRHKIQDQDSMIIFRMRDNHGHVLNNYAIRLTGHKHSPSALPPGFFIDRQKNSKQNGALTYYVNYDVMHGCAAITHDDKTIRPALNSMQELGLNITAQPEDGLIHYQGADFLANQKCLDQFIQPNQTTLIDIVMHRALESKLFELTTDQTPRSFK